MIFQKDQYRRDQDLPLHGILFRTTAGLKRLNIKI